MTYTTVLWCLPGAHEMPPGTGYYPAREGAYGEFACEAHRGPMNAMDRKTVPFSRPEEKK